MKTKPFIILVGCLTLSVLIVFLLILLKEDKASQRYDFVRVFAKEPLRKAVVIDLGYSSYYISGATSEKLYFGNGERPSRMVISSKDLTDTTHVNLTFENGENLRFKSIKISIDSPYFLVSEGTQPYLLRGKISNWHAERFMFDSAYFSLAIPISPTSFVIRSRSSNTQEDVLGKISSDKVVLFPDLLEKQIDGVFCVDGTLLFSKKLQSVVYVYYYRNQYLVMDTAMNLQYRGSTIDPISKAKISPESYSLNGEKTFTMSAPPLLVNRGGCTYGNYLLVNSGIRSKNETDAQIDRASIIDVYDLKSSSYKFSFYINDFDENHLSSFSILNDRLYAKFEKYIVCYDISNVFFEKATI